jgi:cytoskeletal protein CcmA (bactofilin family)
MPLQPVALADTYRNISLKQDQFSSSFSTLTANAVTDTLTLVAGPGISFDTSSDTITILNDFGDENATLRIKGLLVDNISIDTNVIQITESNADLELRANGSGRVYVNDNLNVQNDLNVDGGDLTTAATTFNLLNTTATTVNFAGDAIAVSIGNAAGTTTINNATTLISGDLQVNGGDFTVDALSTSFNLINTNATAINFGGAGTAITIGAASGTTRVRNNLDVDLDLNVDGSSITTSNTTFNVANANATTGNIFGAATIVNIGYPGSSGILTIRNDSTVLEGDLDVNGGDINTNQTSFNLINSTATTVNFAGDAIALEIGASTGNTNINNNLVVDLDLDVNGGDINTNQTSFNLINSTATTVNAFGAATTIEIGASTGNTNINNNLVVDGDITANGGDLTTSATTFNLVNGVATTVNLAGAANNINVGNVGTNVSIPGVTSLGDLIVTRTTTFQGNVTANKDVTIKGSLNLTGDINGGPLRTDDIQIVGNRIETTVSNSNLELNTVGSGSIELFANTNVTGNVVVNSQLTLGTSSISTVSGNQDLTLTAHNTGRVVIETIAISGTNIDTSDSSGISVTPRVTFESDIIAQNGIHTQGHIVPDTDLSYKLGDVNKRFSTAYIDRLTTVTDVEVQYGGTGVSSFTTNGVLYGNSSSAIQVTSASNPGSNATTSYGILTTNSTGVPVWTDEIDGGSY